MKPKTLVGFIALFIILNTVPFLYAAWVGQSGYVFGGFLLNPGDGNSYLAKMYQGWLGSWKGVLPFTAEPGQGVYLFTYYLFLGHVARWFHLSLVLVFHIARVAGGAVLLLALSSFFYHIYHNENKTYHAMLLVAFGSGLGWLAIPFGQFTSDFWVAETYPFLSSVVNPHFPLALAILVWLLTDLDNVKSWTGVFLNVLGAFLLAVLQPFGIVIAVVAIGGKVAWDWWDTKQLSWQKVFWLLIGGGPVIFYQLWVTTANPILANWNKQNQTPAPPLWDIVLALSPALVMAITALIIHLRRKKPVNRLLVSWMVLTILLIYIPFNLQRRFMLGLFIPVVALAIDGIYRVMQEKPNNFRWLPNAVFILSIITNLFVMIGAVLVIQFYQPWLFLTTGENQALEWIKNNTPQDALILSDAEMGVFIPAHTGRRVIYGHPFETVNASEEKQTVDSFFLSKLNEQEQIDLLVHRNVSYIFYGPRDVKGGKPVVFNSLSIAYQASGVTLYKVDQTP